MILPLLLGDCLRSLYGNDAIDRLEAAPQFGELLVEIDAAEAARFDIECARDAVLGDDA